MSDNTGLDAAALALSAYAASKAREAADAADRAERQAFVKGYQHDRATDDERRYYAESVGILYPDPKEEQTASVTSKIIAVLAVGYALYGAWFGWISVRGLDHDRVDAAFSGFFCLLFGLMAFGLVMAAFQFVEWLASRELSDRTAVIVFALPLACAIAWPFVAK